MERDADGKARWDAACSGRVAVQEAVLGRAAERRDGRKGVGTRLRRYHVTGSAGIDIGQRNGRSGYHRT